MPKGSPKLKNARKEEIIDACEKLYRTKTFKEITIKEIGSLTTCGRTSIYNYFQTKEEIFLALLQREYERWIAALRGILAQRETMSVDAFADMLAHSLEERVQLLKIMSMNHYDMESDIRPGQLAEFKAVYGASLRTVEDCLKKYFPDMTQAQRRSFLYIFFPFLFGIYPYVFVTDAQRAALASANVDYVFMSVYEMIYNCVKRLLNG